MSWACFKDERKRKSENIDIHSWRIKMRMRKTAKKSEWLL